MLSRRPNYLALKLPTWSELWLQEQQLKRQALQQAVQQIPQFRPTDYLLIDELRALEEAEPLYNNAAQLYEAELALRSEGELLLQELTVNAWWALATPRERATWRKRVMERSRSADESANDSDRNVNNQC